MRVAFIVNEFPSITETFIVDQIADLIDRGVDVEVFAFREGGNEFISSRFGSYKMSERVTILRPTKSQKTRIYAFGRTVMTNPFAVARLLKIANYRRRTISKLFYKVHPFIGKDFDIIHCHFGNIANAFLDVRDILQLKTPVVTTFYGYDVSKLVNEMPVGYYDRLKDEGSLFFVMSENMKKRVVAMGFPEEKVRVHPVSIDVTKYAFSERKLSGDQPVELLFVGRFVEKKGVDDLIRALAIVRKSARRAFRCSIVGGGSQEAQLRELVVASGLEDLVRFLGFMKIDDIIALMPQMHLLLQPSKTANNGDME